MMKLRSVLILLSIFATILYVTYLGLAGVMRGVTEMERNADKTYKVAGDDSKNTE
jgi:hypothetical protein